MLILSDTHGNYPLALRAIRKASPVDRIVHLGDETDDARLIEELTGGDLLKVRGNCDFTAASIPSELSVSVGPVRIFLTHGDKYNVKSGLSQLHKKALKERAQLVLYGHSHKPAVDHVDGILFVNPGCMNHNSTAPTCAIVEVSDDGLSAEIITVEDE